MSIVHANGVRNALANLIGTTTNTGGGTAKLQLKASATVVVAFDLPSPAFDTAPATGVGVISLAGTPIAKQAAASGNVDSFVLLDKGGSQVMSGSVTSAGMGGDIEVTNVNVAVSQDCSLSSLTYTAPV